MKTIPYYEVSKVTNLKEMLSHSVNAFGPRPAFHVKKKEIGYIPVTYSQFGKDVDSLGTALIDTGLKDTRIAIIGENRYEWAVSYLAVVNGTGTVVPLDKDLPPAEIENLVVMSGVSAVIFSGKYKDIMAGLSAKIPSIRFFINMDSSENNMDFLSFELLLKKGENLVQNGDRRFLDAQIDEKTANIMLFTSGTTDVSKAVLLSHENLCSNLMDMCSMIVLKEDDIFLSVLPLHHTYECTCGFLCPIYMGASVAYCEGLRHIADNLQESHATIMLAVPLIFESMYKKLWDQAEKTKSAGKLRFAIKLSNFLRTVFKIDLTKKLFATIHEKLGGKVRIFISGAAAINPDVAKGFRDLGILFLQGYGLTECSPILTVNRDVIFNDASAGLPLPGVELKIDSPNEEGIGEIIARGKNVFLGYFDNELATANAIKDGWFYTGDLGYLNKDNFLFITGRKKNVIVTKNGKNIYPEEIEALLNTSKYIKESMVWGKYDESSGDTIICAKIVADYEKIEDEFKDTPLTPEQIRQLIGKEIKAVNKKLPLYKYVHDYSVREEEFIKTTTRKIKRHLETTE